MKLLYVRKTNIAGQWLVFCLFLVGVCLKATLNLLLLVRLVDLHFSPRLVFPRAASREPLAASFFLVKKHLPASWPLECDTPDSGRHMGDDRKKEGASSGKAETKYPSASTNFDCDPRAGTHTRQSSFCLQELRHSQPTS